MNFLRRYPLLAFAVLICSIPLQPGLAQNDRLVLNVTVVYEGKQPLPTLEAGDFTVLVDKQPQKIVSFNHGNAPVSVGILVDVSGSTARFSDKALDHFADGIDTLFQLSNPQNDYFVVAFQVKPGMLQNWTNDPQAIRSKLLPIKPDSGSALYDAVYQSIQHVKTGRHQKRVLILLSDGFDNNSEKTFNEVRDALKDSDVLLYSIALINEEGSGSALAQEGKGILDELSEVSGGQALLLQNGSKAKAINKAFELLATEVRSQYELVIEPAPMTGARKWRKVKVTAAYTDVHGKRKELKVRTREGFYR
ncbi:MAG TPA: VWA domain-containing protein [Pyrinomonadaceae bacterium]